MKSCRGGEIDLHEAAAAVNHGTMKFLTAIDNGVRDHYCHGLRKNNY